MNADRILLVWNSWPQFSDFFSLVFCEQKQRGFKGNVICFSLSGISERNIITALSQATSSSVNQDSFLKYLLLNCHKVVYIFSGELNLRVIRTIAILQLRKE